MNTSFSNTNLNPAITKHHDIPIRPELQVTAKGLELAGIQSLHAMLESREYDVSCDAAARTCTCRDMVFYVSASDQGMYQCVV